MILSISNHKGGTGKTTTALNLSSCLEKKGKSVLLIDLDPQANLSYSLGIITPPHDVVDWLLKKTAFPETLHKVSGIHLLPSSRYLYDKETEFTQLSKDTNHAILRRELKNIEHNYEYIIIDCPPSFSVFTINALAASDYVLIPTLFDVLSLQGIDQVLKFISHIKKTINAELNVIGVLGVNVDERRQLTYEVLEYIRDNYRINIFNNYIRANVKAAEAPSFAKSVIDYAPESNSAKDYIAFTNEFISATNHHAPEKKTFA